MLVLLALQPTLAVTVLDASLVDELITAATIFNGVLPLKVKLVPLLMQPFEFLSSLIELDLRGLGFSNFLLELLSFTSNFNRQFFDLKSQLLDLGFISTAEFFKSQVIFLLLAGSERPLLQLLLVPIHLQLELIHSLVGLEDHILNVVQPILLVGDPLFELLDFVAQTATLPLCDLFQMLLSFNLLILRIY